MATQYSTVVKTLARGAWPAVGPKIGLVENEIDVTAVNSGIFVDGDSIQALSIPAGSLVLAAGMEVTEAFVGDVQCVVDLGTGTDVNRFVDGSSTSGFDVGTSGTQKAVGTYSQVAPSVTTAVDGTALAFASADTIDVLLETMNGGGATFTAGKLRVWALVVDIDGMDG